MEIHIDQFIQERHKSIQKMKQNLHLITEVQGHG